MKFTIQPTERKEFVNLPEREPDDFIRELRSRSQEPERERLGQSRRFDEPNVPQSEEGISESSTRDPLESFLDGMNDLKNGTLYDETGEAKNDIDSGQDDSGEGNPPEPLWKRSKWPAAIFLAALVMFGGLWYLASRSDSDLMLARVKIEGANLLSTHEVLALANIDRSVPFYNIDLKRIEHRLLRHSLIRSAQVLRELDPPTIVLVIQERQPVAFLRSETNGEAYIIDRDGLLLRPKLLAGLRDPAQLLQVPLLTGVSEHDTAGYLAMADMVTMIERLDSGALAHSIGELHRTPTGDYVIYTSATQTPIFIGSPFEHAFRTALEEQAGTVPNYSEPLFDRQLELLARAWKPSLAHEILAGKVLYVDARFNGQIILKQKSPMGAAANGIAIAPQLHTNNAHYATNAIQPRPIRGPRTIN